METNFQHNAHSIRRRGFTLLELVVAISLGAIAVSLSVQAILSMMATFRVEEFRQDADDDAKMLMDYLVSRLQPVGGDALRPWAVVDTVNSTTGSDRLVIFEADDTLPQCPVPNTSGANLNVGNVPLGDGGSGCCLTNAFNNRSFMLVKGNNFANLRATNVNTGPCNLQTNPGQGANPNPSHGALANLTPGTVVSGKVTAIFRDAGTNTLRLWSDNNGDLVETSNEVTVLADRVFDFQVARGYDKNTVDGIITDTNSAGDEWLYNNSGDNWNFDAGVLHGDLRMLWLGIVVGVPAKSGARSKIDGLLDGPNLNVPGYHLASITGKTYLRNLFFFN